MAKFEVGDRVIAIDLVDGVNLAGKKGTVVGVEDERYRLNTEVDFDEMFSMGHSCGGKAKLDCGRVGNHSEFKFLDDNKNNMNIKEKFVLAVTPEPKKSFRKAEITNGDDILTDDGSKIFLTWLLHEKYADEFKKDVVDGILKDKKEEK